MPWPFSSSSSARGPAVRAGRVAAGRHLLVWDAGCSWLLWKGYLKSSLLPLLPELTRITLMGLVLSPMLRGPGRGPEGNTEGRSRS